VFWFIILIVGITSFLMPWTFKYIIMMPFLGTVLGCFLWGVMGLFGVPVWSWAAFGGLIAGGMLFVGIQIRIHDP
jgi:hypothetical protein